MGLGPAQAGCSLGLPGRGGGAGPPTPSFSSRSPRRSSGARRSRPHIPPLRRSPRRPERKREKPSLRPVHPDLKGRGYTPLRGAKAAEAASSSRRSVGKTRARAVGYRLSPRPGLTSTGWAFPSAPAGRLFSSHGFQPVDRPRAAFSSSFVQAPAGRLNAFQTPLKGARG